MEDNKQNDDIGINLNNRINDINERYSKEFKDKNLSNETYFWCLMEEMKEMRKENTIFKERVNTCIDGIGKDLNKFKERYFTKDTVKAMFSLLFTLIGALAGYVLLGGA